MMTDEQRSKLKRMHDERGIHFREEDFRPVFDLPTDYVAGWIGNMYAGVAPDGRVSS